MNAAVPMALAEADSLSDLDTANASECQCTSEVPVATRLADARSYVTSSHIDTGSGSIRLRLPVHWQWAIRLRLTPGRPLSLRPSGPLPVNTRIATTTPHPYDGNGRIGLFWDRDTSWYFDLDDLFKASGGVRALSTSTTFAQATSASSFRREESRFTALDARVSALRALTAVARQLTLLPHILLLALVSEGLTAVNIRPPMKCSPLNI